MTQKLISCLLLSFCFLCVNGLIVNATNNLNFSPNFSPDETLRYHGYFRGAVCNPSAPIRHPTTDAEVVAIVNEAIRRGTTVKAFGSRHSLTDILCTHGIPVDMTRIRGMWMNVDDQSVIVGAGENLHDLAEFLKQNSRGLKTTPGFGNITIGGAIGTGAHGSSTKYTSSISEQVIGLTIVDGFGNIRVIRENQDLRGFRVHLGLLGIILRVTLRTEPLYKVQGHNYVVSDRILFDGTFKDIVQATDQISLYWYPSLEQVVIANWTIVDVNTPGEAWTNDHVPSTTFAYNFKLVTALESVSSVEPACPGVTLTGTQLVEDVSLLHLITGIPGTFPIYTYDGVTTTNPAVGYYHRMFSPICFDSGVSQCPWFHGPFNLTQLDNEFSLDINNIPMLVRTVKDILIKYPAAFPLDGILLRFSAASQTYMSTSYGRDTCHFEFYLKTRNFSQYDATPGLAAYQTILQSIIFTYQGRPHWGKAGAAYHSAGIIARSLNLAAKNSFLELMSKYDPNGIFLNDFGNRLKGSGRKQNIDPDVIHCALLDNCFCKEDEDCATGQKCSTINGYPYNACINPFVNPQSLLTSLIL